MLCRLHPEMMADALASEVDALGIEGGISDGDRRRRLDELRDALRDLERREEAAIEMAAEQGQDIPRRPAASSVAVLGVRVVGAQELAA